jgi:hypothetical protein
MKNSPHKITKTLIQSKPLCLNLHPIKTVTVADSIKAKIEKEEAILDKLIGHK